MRAFGSVRFFENGFFQSNACATEIMMSDYADIEIDVKVDSDHSVEATQNLNVEVTNFLS